MSALRHDARALFAAAREDGPGARQRAAVFRGVAVATGIAGGAAAVSGAASAAPAGTVVVAAANVAETATVAGAGALAGAGTASIFSMKLLAIGALIGVVSTGLGVVLAVTFVVPPSSREAPPRVRTAGTAPANGGGASEARLASTPTRVIAPGAKLAMPAARGRDTATSDAKAKAEAARAEATARTENASAEAPSDLAEEARLVTAARSALVAGDAARALALVQATRKLGARALEPEELGLEARALRALGRADDAAATELVLRRRYPESALAR
jgi:flagellar hook-length control protein FliK